MNKHESALRHACVMVVLSFSLMSITAAGLAQSPVIEIYVAGAPVVAGQAEPGSGPITVYNTSYDAWAPIGRENSMDTAGNFAVSVNPPLKAGDTILAEDAQGRQSASVTVLEPTGSAAGPTPE